MEERRFYVYVYLDPRRPGVYSYEEYSFDYEPFYIGKGSNYRWREHLWNYKQKDNKFFHGKIGKIRKQLQMDPIVLKVKEGLTEEESFSIEIKLITLIGRRDLSTGPLTNFTNGGGSLLKCVRKPWSEETREKIMKIRKEHPPRLGKHNSEETKLKQSLAKKGKALSEEHKSKLSEVRRGKEPWNKGQTKENNESLKRMSESKRGESNYLFGKKRTEEEKQKLRERTKGKTWEEIVGVEKAKEVKEKISNGKKGKSHSLETITKLKEFKGDKSSKAKIYIIIKDGIVTEKKTTFTDLEKELSLSYYVLSEMIKTGREKQGVKLILKK